ncbi:hypothetical protein [Streptomyces sp. LaPpAH-108]|uniref:hypothetical protein n=1 Tax=Streptomyces sp. LaPpAH-108 TaxID=1155714 RepID=UPI0003690D67|nr:hypothetical protein [Streptomyces sp. LaPpAH-108]
MNEGNPLYVPEDEREKRPGRLRLGSAGWNPGVLPMPGRVPVAWWGMRNSGGTFR